MSPATWFLLLISFWQTIYIVAISSGIAIAAGVPLGVILFLTRKGHFLEQKFVYQILAAIINVTRSIPFIILMIAIIPFTRLVVGTSIGTNAAIVPLSLCAIPFMARVVENTLLEVDHGLIEAALAMGATPLQIIMKVLLPESLAGVLNGLVLTMISLVGYSAMAGAVGGGGLGDLAIRYGYQRFNVTVMILTIILLVVLVQAIQFAGDKLLRRIKHLKTN